ncbi:MAG: archaeosortase/exosortase family protein [Gemmatimonadetes bacterium]|nr:archaeosortase/exosortase family protein [Gemmatimonadota bacterium]
MAPWLAGLLALVWALAVLFFRANRIWLPYYILGSVGLAFILIFVGRATPIEPLLQHSVAAGVHAVSEVVHIPTKIFRAAPGAVLVLVISQDVGWTMLQVTVESSGLLESAVITGMLMFYPGWSLGKRAYLTLGALLATYVANIVRMMVIVTTLHFVGKDSLLFSHTIIGRAVFFVIVIAIYWYLMTRPTLRTVRQKLDQELWA